LKGKRGIAGEINYIIVEKDDICNLKENFMKMIISIDIVNDIEIANVIKNVITFLELVKLRLFKVGMLRSSTGDDYGFKS
jgi:hypothetical protein